MSETAHKLQRLLDMTSEIQRLIAADEWDNAVEKLRVRTALLAELNETEFGKIAAMVQENENCAESGSMSDMIRSIIEVEESNKRAVDASVRRSASVLVNLTQEKQKLRDLRAMAQISQKQIIDFVH